MKSRPIALPEREAVRATDMFRQWAEERRLEAQRRRDDHQAKLEAKRTELARAKHDHEAYVIAATAEINALLANVEDEQEVIDAADRALTQPRQIEGGQ